jgi:hypothetical protein
MYVNDPTAAEVDELRNTASRLISIENTLADAGATVESVTTDVEVPPELEITSVSRPGVRLTRGESITVELTILNVGSRPANSVILTHETDLTLSPNEREISELEPEQRRTVPFEVTASSVGELSVRFEASSSNAGTASKSIPFVVLSRTDVYESVINTLQDLINKINSNDSISDTLGSELVSILNSATSDLEQAITELDAGNTTGANVAARQATVRIGEFLNSFSEVGGLSRTFSQTVENNAELAIEQISDTVEVLSINEAIDRNDNGLIDDDEILRAIDLWRSDEAVPGTGGKTIGGTKILELIDAWRNETEVR